KTRLPRGSRVKATPLTVATRSSLAGSGLAPGSISGSEYTTNGALLAPRSSAGGESELRGACFTLTTKATKLVGELFRILTSSKPSGRRLNVVVICASNEKAQSTEA